MKTKRDFLHSIGYLYLHKKPYKTRFIANSSSCTTTELSKLLTSCLTTITSHGIKYCEKVYERSGNNFFGQSNIQREVLNKQQERRRSRVVRAARLWCRKSPYRVSSRLGWAMRRLENSLCQPSRKWVPFSN